MAVSTSVPVHSSIPALEAEAVTPHNTNNFSKLARALYIGGAGNATLVMENDDPITFNGLLAGTILPVRCKRVNAGATATNIVALF